MTFKDLRNVWAGDAYIVIKGEDVAEVAKPFDFVEKHGKRVDGMEVWAIKSGLRTDGLAIIELA